MSKPKTNPPAVAPAIKPPGIAAKPREPLTPLEQLRRAMALSRFVPADVVLQEAAALLNMQAGQSLLGEETQRALLAAQAERIVALEQQVAELQAAAESKAPAGKGK